MIIKQYLFSSKYICLFYHFGLISESFYYRFAVNSASSPFNNLACLLQGVLYMQFKYSKFKEDIKGNGYRMKESILSHLNLSSHPFYNTAFSLHVYMYKLIKLIKVHTTVSIVFVCFDHSYKIMTHFIHASII